ncbi:MAG: hypothetical protein K9W43_11540 [Candidatus Thorarchaeota archaeon]|nr:hypothetical protein [Candidatus Thorarchaeota archaeon]
MTITKERITEFVRQACRLPRNGVRRIGTYTAKLYGVPRQSDFVWRKREWSMLLVLMLMLVQLPYIWSLSYSLPIDTKVVTTTKVSSPAFYHTKVHTSPAFTTVSLINLTPFAPLHMRDVIAKPAMISSMHAEDDGYHIECPGCTDWNYIQFHFNNFIQGGFCDNVTASLKVHVKTGAPKFDFEVRIPTYNKDIRQDLIVEKNQTATLRLNIQLGPISDSSLAGIDKVWTDLWITSSDTFEIIIESLLIEATFTKELYPVTFTVTTSEGENFLEDQLLYFAYPPPILYIKNDTVNETYSLLFIENNVTTFYLAPGIYTGYVKWLESSRVSVKLVVLPDRELSVVVGLKVLKIDISRTPQFMFTSLSISVANNRLYEMWGMLANVWPVRTLYIPEFTGPLRIEIEPLEPVEPFKQGQRIWPDSIVLKSFIDPDTNSSFNLRAEINLPYVEVFGLSLGLGEVILMLMVGYCAVILVAWSRKTLEHRSLRSLSRDPRFPSVVLLVLSIFVPWIGVPQQPTTCKGSYPFCLQVYHWTVWLVVPVVLFHQEGYSAQLFELREWFSLSLLSFLFFVLPLIALIYKMSIPIEEEEATSHFSLLLAMPLVLVAAGVIIAYQLGGTLYIGSLLAMTAIPVWVIQRFLERLGIQWKRSGPLSFAY